MNTEVNTPVDENVVDENAVAAPAAEVKAPRVKLPEQNGVSRPAGAKTGAVWTLADQISAAAKRPALREEVMAAGEAQGINRGTIATQYARWTQFYGVSKEARSAAREAAKPVAEPTPEAAPEATEE